MEVDQGLTKFQKYVKSIRLRPHPANLIATDEFQKYVKLIRLRPLLTKLKDKLEFQKYVKSIRLRPRKRARL